MLVLPGALFGYGSIGFSEIAGSMDSLLGIYSRTIGMAGYMCCGYRLTRSTGSRARGIIFSYFTRGSMRIKRSLADDRHLEHPGLYPFQECFDCLSRATVIRKFFFKIRQATLVNIN